MKTIILTTILCISTVLLFGQSDPIALDYPIGSFRIDERLNKQISTRFAQLNMDKTYVVTIVGSADFLGSADNNQVLSNKRVKFAEYHLLKNYSNMRLIIKLDSKGEMEVHNREKTNNGIQEHRMVHIYIEDYNAGQPISSIANPSIVDANGQNDITNHLHGRTVATASAAQAEELTNVPVSVTQQTIKPISETARIEIAKREAESRRLQDAQNGTANPSSTPVITDHDVATTSSSLEAVDTKGNDESAPIAESLALGNGDEPKKFDEDGSFTVGDKLLLSDLNFRPGSHYLRPSSIPTLRKLINVLEANPTLKIEIIGHICCHPDYSVHPDGFDREAGNHKLSYNRANNIKEYLEKNGIDSSRLSASGKGAKERLVYPEETDEDRIKNRRVEIKILAL